MTHTHTVESLIAFTNRVKEAFAAKRIAAPVHLNSSTQAEPLLKIFEHIRPQDWVFSTWRSTYHALLKGIPEEEVFQAILEGRSMYLMFKEHRFFSSAIVGGILPIALGVAAGIKRRINEFIDEQNGKEAVGSFHQFDVPLVYVFVGDMCFRTGLYHEFAQYVMGHSLPIRVICENNGYSTNAVTEDVWGGTQTRCPVTTYKYTRTEPHVGLSQRVSF